MPEHQSPHETEAALRARFTTMLFNETDDLIKIIDDRNLSQEEKRVLQEILVDFIPYLLQPHVPQDKRNRIQRVKDAFHEFEENDPTDRITF